MKTSIKIALAVGCVVAGLAGCGSTPKQSPFEFNYAVDNAAGNGIVQVFDLAGNTVVQIRGLNPATTHFKDQRNVEIAHEVVGENVVLKGIQPIFTVTTALTTSKVVRTVPMPSAAAALQQTAASAAEPVDPAIRSQYLTNAGLSVDSTNDELLAEIARIKKEIATLKATIAAAEATGIKTPSATIVQADDGGAGSAARATNRSVETSDDEVIRVFFKDNSDWFAPDSETKARIAGLVQKAKNIKVTGYTDTNRATAGSEALARNRADAARKYLIQRGIDGNKIRVSFEAAGKFMADNDTAKGKAVNRRVEIRGS